MRMSRMIFVSMMLAILSTSIVPIFNGYKYCINHIFSYENEKNVSKNNNHTVETKSTIAKIWIGGIFKSSFISAKAGGVKIFLDKGIIKDKNKYNYMQDRLADLASVLAAKKDGGYKNIEKIYIGGRLEKVGGKNQYKIFTRDGKETILERPYMVIPESGLTVKCQTGIATCYPSSIKINIEKNRVFISNDDTTIIRISDDGNAEGYFHFVE